jgi:uncharacterized protein DUF3570
LTRRSAGALAAGILLASALVARADDRVTIRGAYYREPSTRVIQPVVDITKDLPRGFDIEAHYLVDAITSASASAGTTVDSVFTEIRNEVGLGVGKSWERTRATLGYKYSAESDYWSHSIAGSLAWRVWADTATVAISGGQSFDQVGFRARTPNCLSSGVFPGDNSCKLNATFAGVSYTQVLSAVAIAQLNLDTSYLSGFLANPYRQVPNFGYEVVPDKRERSAVAARIAYYWPGAQTGAQLHYRFYWDFYPGTSLEDRDPWLLRAHTVEARIYHQVTHDLEVRLLYRQYFQNAAAFWCDVLDSPSCYAPGGSPLPYESTDPKLGNLRTEYPEVKLLWDAESLQAVPFFRWFAAGTFEISYGRYFQNDSFGDAHVLQAGYSMPY